MLFHYQAKQSTEMDPPSLCFGIECTKKQHALNNSKLKPTFINRKTKVDYCGLLNKCCDSDQQTVNFIWSAVISMFYMDRKCSVTGGWDQLFGEGGNMRPTEQFAQPTASS